MKAWLARSSSHIPLPVLIVIPALLLSTLAIALTGWVTIRHTRMVSLELADDLLTSRLQHTHDRLYTYLDEVELANQLTYPFVAEQMRTEQQLDGVHLRRQFDITLAVFPHLSEIGVTQLTPDGARIYANLRSPLLVTLTTSVTVTYSTALTAAQVALSSPLTTTTQHRLLPNTAPLQQLLARLRAADGPQWVLRDDLPQVGLIAAYLNPIRADDGQLLGGVHTNISMHQMSTFLASIRSSPDELLLIVNPDGRVVAASSSLYPTTANINIHTSSDALLQPLSRGLQSGALCLSATDANSTPYSFEVAGQRYFGRALACHDNDNLEWIVIAVLPEATVLPSPARSPTLLLVLLLVSLAAAAVTGVLTAVWVVGPLRQLDRATQQLAQGNWNYTLAPSLMARRDTLGNLGRSFDIMAQHLQQAFATVAERNAALHAEVEQHQHTAQQLRQNQHLLQGILDHAPLSIVVYDTEARFRLVNAYTRGLYPHSEGDLIGQSLLAALSPTADGARYLAQIQQVAQSGVPLRGEFTYTATGPPRQYTYIIFPIFDEDHHVEALGEISIDVTERYHAEQALRESEQRLRQIIENAPLPIFIHVDGHVFFANQAAADLYACPVEELIGQASFDLAMPDEHAQVAQHIGAVATQRGGKGVFHIQTRRGEIRTVEANSTFLTHHDKEMLLTIAVDITERVAAEQALHESEQRFRDTVEYAPLPVFMHANQRVLFCNHAAAELLGYSLAEQVLIDIWQLIHPDDTSKVQSLVEAIRVNRSATAEFRLQTRHHGVRTVESHTTYLFYRGESVLLSMLVDVTERRHIEQALRDSYTHLQTLNQQVHQSRDALRSLLDGLNDAIMMVDQTGIVVNLNNAMADLLQQPVNTLSGQQWQDVWRAHPSFAPLHDLVQRALATDTPQQGQVRDADNPQHPRIYQIATIPVTSKQDQSRRVIVIITDITEQLQLQEYLAQTEAFAANAMLAASVAHEINTPLQTVLNALAFMPQAAPEDQAQLMQAASSEIKRAGHIVRQFLDLYRKGSQDVDQVDINAILERLLLLLGKRIKEQGVSLTCSFDDQQPQVLGHTDRLTQVCLNILVNALDAMPKSGSLTVQTAVVKIEQQLYVAVQIADTGVGIPDTVLPHIFEPFVTSKPNGTGLGLPISYQIIQQHHGSIYVSSEVNIGTTFTVVLPLDGSQWKVTATKESLIYETPSTHLAR